MTDLTSFGLWIVIGLVAGGTFGLRASIILLFGWLGDMPPRVQNALRFIPAAVLAGLAFPSFVYLDGALAVTAGNERLLAGVFATIVAWRTENMLLTIAVGMVVLWVAGGVI